MSSYREKQRGHNFTLYGNQGVQDEIYSVISLFLNKVLEEILLYSWDIEFHNSGRIYLDDGDLTFSNNINAHKVTLYFPVIK